MSTEQRQEESELTGISCVAAANAIEKVFLTHYPPRKLEGSSLAEGIRGLRELGEFPGQLFQEDPRLQGPGPRKAMLAIGAARSMRIARTLLRARDIPGMEVLLSHIRNLNPLQPSQGEGKAWDLLLEVEVAAMARAVNAEVRFDEPDVVLCNKHGAEFAFACKRPKKQSSIPNAISDALRQCRKSDLDSIAIIAVDRLTQPGVMLRGKTSAQHEYRKLIDKCCGVEIERSRQALRDLHVPADGSRPLHGIMFVGFPCNSRVDPSRYAGWLLLSQFCSRLVANQGVPRSFATLKWFQQVLEAGDVLLRKAPLE